jgi:hypothetical protein
MRLKSVCRQWAWTWAAQLSWVFVWPGAPGAPSAGRRLPAGSICQRAVVWGSWLSVAALRRPALS